MRTIRMECTIDRRSQQHIKARFCRCFPGDQTLNTFAFSLESQDLIYVTTGPSLQLGLHEVALNPYLVDKLSLSEGAYLIRPKLFT